MIYQVEDRVIVDLPERFIFRAGAFHAPWRYGLARRCGSD